eukprot:CAMPEP_0170246710 /NCGR_PEP_ID=MMETSP0116_2-20130129/23143_1 /TAXON_ID=400756 /ORGANISM="Durinskia baltica, Strain CSIRO CS-38" /LENGTH=155 /DNA_ID=CAMNT_0010497589 /DNA_START=143 /DNA_END=607 /DNA_ORIENTATION=+
MEAPNCLQQPHVKGLSKLRRRVLQSLDPDQTTSHLGGSFKSLHSLLHVGQAMPSPAPSVMRPTSSAASVADARSCNALKLQAAPPPAHSSSTPTACSKSMLGGAVAATPVIQQAPTKAPKIAMPCDIRMSAARECRGEGDCHEHTEAGGIFPTSR